MDNAIGSEVSCLATNTDVPLARPASASGTFCVSPLSWAYTIRSATRTGGSKTEYRTNLHFIRGQLVSDDSQQFRDDQEAVDFGDIEEM